MRHETAVSRTFVESLRFGSLAREKLLLAALPPRFLGPALPVPLVCASGKSTAGGLINLLTRLPACSLLFWSHVTYQIFAVPIANRAVQDKTGIIHVHAPILSAHIACGHHRNTGGCFEHHREGETRFIQIGVGFIH